MFIYSYSSSSFTIRFIFMSLFFFLFFRLYVMTMNVATQTYTHHHHAKCVKYRIEHATAPEFTNRPLTHSRSLQMPNGKEYKLFAIFYYFGAYYERRMHSMRKIHLPDLVVSDLITSKTGYVFAFISFLFFCLRFIFFHIFLFSSLKQKIFFENDN